MPQVIQETANRVYLTKRQATIIADTLRLVLQNVDLAGDDLAEVNELHSFLQNFLERSDWSPMEK